MTSGGEYRLPAIVCDADKLSQVAIIQECGSLGIPVVALSSCRRAIGFASRYARRQLICPVPSYQAEYISFLTVHVPRGVIFCSNDANAENLSRFRNELLAQGFSLLISDHALLERVIEKDRLYQTALESGISVPKCRLVASAAELEERLDEFALPMILKSTNLAGGVYRFIHNREDAVPVFRQMTELIRSEGFLHREARLMAQEWIPQADTTLWNFNACVDRGDVLSYSMGRRIRTDLHLDGTLGSVLLFGRTAHNAGLLEENLRLLRHLWFSGIVETEWSESASGRRFLYDFNPRPSGNIRWAFKSGVSLAEQYYRAALGLSPRRQVMRTGIVYAKVLYKESDWLESLGNPRLTLLDKIRVLGEDLLAVACSRRHAVDVLDPRDLGPTLRASAGLLTVLAQSAKRKIRRFLHAGTSQFGPMKCQPR